MPFWEVAICVSMKDRPSGRNPLSSDRLKITMKQQLRKENIDYGVFYIRN